MDPAQPHKDPSYQTGGGTHGAGDLFLHLTAAPAAVWPCVSLSGNGAGGGNGAPMLCRSGLTPLTTPAIKFRGRALWQGASLSLLPSPTPSPSSQCSEKLKWAWSAGCSCYVTWVGGWVNRTPLLCGSGPPLLSPKPASCRGAHSRGAPFTFPSLEQLGNCSQNHAVWGLGFLCTIAPS